MNWYAVGLSVVILVSVTEVIARIIKRKRDKHE